MFKAVYDILLPVREGFHRDPVTELTLANLIPQKQKRTSQQLVKTLCMLQRRVIAIFFHQLASKACGTGSYLDIIRLCLKASSLRQTINQTLLSHTFPALDLSSSSPSSLPLTPSPLVRVSPAYFRMKSLRHVFLGKLLFSKINGCVSLSFSL